MVYPKPNVLLSKCIMMKKSAIGLLTVFTFVLCTGFSLGKKKKIKVPECYEYIPSGTLNLAKDDKVSIRGFYMSTVEVTNKDYNEFLASLEQQGKTDLAEKARIEKERWQQKPAYGEPFVETYSSHPAYAEYPVVNVSLEGAKLFCEYITDHWNKKYPHQAYELKFRLPTRAEWKFAARAGSEHAYYPWGGYYLRNNKGQLLANFKRHHPASLKYDPEKRIYEIVDIPGASSPFNGKMLNDNAHITAPSESFAPNPHGMFNMSGNVSEFLLDGSTIGGSWGSTAYYLHIDAEDEYPELNGEASKFVGFRPIIEIQAKGTLDD